MYKFSDYKKEKNYNQLKNSWRKIHIY